MISYRLVVTGSRDGHPFVEEGLDNIRKDLGRASRPGSVGVCAAFPRTGSRGTWDCIRQAHDAGFDLVIADVPADAREVSP